MNLILSNKYGKCEYIKNICRKSKQKNVVINYGFLSFFLTRRDNYNWPLENGGKSENRSAGE